MKHLKRYNETLTNKYSIYDWFEDIKSLQRNNYKTNSSDLKKWCDHFIGSGIYEQINSHIDKIFKSLDSVDDEDIFWRMIDIFDEYSYMNRIVKKSVSYGHYDNINKPIELKYTGTLVNIDTKKDRIRVMVSMLLDILSPTLFIGGFPSANLRTTQDEEYVNDEKYQCKNFNIENFKLKVGDLIPTPENYKKKEIEIFQHDFNKFKNYSVNNIINMYQPSIYIWIHGDGKLNLGKIESQIDEVMTSVLNDINYEGVIYETPRGENKRYIDTWYPDITVSDYTLKIILKLK